MDTPELARRLAPGAVALAIWGGGLLGTVRDAIAAEPPPLRDVTPVEPSAIREALDKGDVARALELVRRELSAPPAARDVGALRLLESRLLARQGEADSAAIVGASVLTDSTWGEHALDDLHARALERGEFARAESLVAFAPTTATSNGSRLRAEANFVRGRFEAADSSLAAFAEPWDASTILLAGNVALARGKTPEANASFDRLLASPDVPPRLRAFAHSGKAQIARREVAQATRVLENERALREGPFAAASFDAGLALRELGRGEEARLRFLESMRGSPPVATSARLAIADLDRKAGKIDESRESLAAAMTGEVGDVFAMTRLGESLVIGGRRDDAESLHRAARAALPEIDERLLDGDLPYLETPVDSAELPIEDPRRLALAVVAHLAGNEPVALGWADGATEQTPSLLLVHALSLERVGRTTEARVELERLADAGFGSWLVEEHRLRLTPPDERATFESIAGPLLASLPRDPRLRVRVARLRERGGDLEGAIALLREARSVGWLTNEEKRKLRDEIEDLEDLDPASIALPEKSSAASP